MARHDAILWMAALAATGFVQPVAAQADDATRAVIEDQLKAFLGDDGPRAWSHASPGIQSMFRTTDNFMAMVRQGYQPVYRPKAWSFGPLRDTPAGPEQEVRITDAAGEDWLAIYTMERQPDGSWKIAGCRLIKAPPPTT